MDKNILNSKDRIEYINKIINNNKADFNKLELEKMANYIIEISEKEDKINKKYNILTNNRMQTIKKREVSLEQMLQNEEQKETNNSYLSSIEMKKKENKNLFLCRKNIINKEDLSNFYINQIENCIIFLKNKINDSNYQYKDDIAKIKSIIIELKKDQYIIKNCINKTIYFNKINFIKKHEMNYYEKTGYVNNNNYVFINDSTFYFHDPKHLSALIQNYNLLKQSSINEVQSTIYWILIDFENLLNFAFKDEKNNKYKDIVFYKMHDYSNEEINNILKNKYGKGYSLMYISSLINKIIPNFLSEKYNEYITEWLYTYKKYGKWKKCSKCKKIKLANKYNFSVNKKGKYGFHSICKECRQKER